jgi:spore coat protein U-like protein
MRLLPAVLCALWILTAAAADAGCTIFVSGVSFGAYDVFDPQPTDSTGRIVYICGRQDKRIRITLTTGQSGRYSVRTMRNGNEALNYNLYLEPFAVVWGDPDVDGSTGAYYENNPKNFVPVPLTIHGRIPALQDVTPGRYTDYVQAQIDF